MTRAQAEPDYDDTDDEIQPVYVQFVPYSQAAIGAFVCGVIAILSGPAGIVFGPLAVIGGHVARRRTRTGELRGDGLAGWALGLGYLGIAFGIVLFLNSMLG